jgi:hypothetical protein
MASKKQVIALAEKLGASFEETQYDFVLSAPAGKVLDGGIHYSAFEKGSEYASTIYSQFYFELKKMSDCDCEDCKRNLEQVC